MFKRKVKYHCDYCRDGESHPQQQDKGNRCFRNLDTGEFYCSCHKAVEQQDKECKCSEHSAEWRKGGWMCSNCYKINKCEIGGKVKCCPDYPHSTPKQDKEECKCEHCKETGCKEKNCFECENHTHCPEDSKPCGLTCSCPIRPCVPPKEGWFCIKCCTQKELGVPCINGCFTQQQDKGIKFDCECGLSDLVDDGKCFCKCHSTSTSESWATEFDKKFSEKYSSFPQYERDIINAHFNRTNVKKFISSLISQERQRAKQEALKEIMIEISEIYQKHN